MVGFASAGRIKVAELTATAAVFEGILGVLEVLMLQVIQSRVLPEVDDERAKVFVEDQILFFTC